MHETDRAEIERIVESLTAAWNASDGAAFARSFAADAEFVNIFAMHFTGRAAIAKQHQVIFDGVYQGSRIAFRATKIRLLRDDTALVYIGSTLHVPAGPLAGEMRTLASAVLVRESPGWHIIAFHNTREVTNPLAAAPAVS